MFRYVAAHALRRAWQAGQPGQGGIWVLPAYSGAPALPAGASKLAVAAKYVAGVGATLWASQQEEVADRARLAWHIALRLTRDVVTAASIVAGEGRC